MFMIVKVIIGNDCQFYDHKYMNWYKSEPNDFNSC
jgi:hypothetical protein